MMRPPSEYATCVPVCHDDMRPALKGPRPQRYQYILGLTSLWLLSPVVIVLWTAQWSMSITAIASLCLACCVVSTLHWRHCVQHSFLHRLDRRLAVALFVVLVVFTSGGYARRKLPVCVWILLPWRRVGVLHRCAVLCEPGLGLRELGMPRGVSICRVLVGFLGHCASRAARCAVLWSSEYHGLLVAYRDCMATHATFQKKVHLRRSLLGGLPAPHADRGCVYHSAQYLVLLRRTYRQDAGQFRRVCLFTLGHRLAATHRCRRLNADQLIALSLSIIRNCMPIVGNSLTQVAASPRYNPAHAFKLQHLPRAVEYPGIIGHTFIKVL